MAVLQDRISVIIQVSIDWSKGPQARFKRRATAVPNSVDRIKFDFYTAVTRRLKPAVARLGFKRHAIAVPNSIHKL